jgi:hypothetical protein
VTTLISVGPSGGNGAIAADFDGASTDGTKVFVLYRFLRQRRPRLLRDVRAAGRSGHGQPTS